MEGYSPEEMRAMEEQRQRELAAANAQAKAQRDAAARTKAAAAAPKPTPKQVAKSTPKPQDNRGTDGIITQLGRVADSVMSGDWMSDGLNAVAAGINQITPQNSPVKGFTQGLDDNVRSSQEIDTAVQQREQQVKEKGSPVEKALQGTATNLQAVAEGGQAGIALPLTVAARFTGQNAPWNNAPALVKDSPVGETIFEITRVVAPTILTSGVANAAGWATHAAGLSTAGALVGESAMETAFQDSADDLVAGRQMAQWVGEIADHLGYDGSQITREMIEGKTPTGQGLTAAVGFLQNFGINWGAERFLKYVGDSISRGKAAANGVTNTKPQKYVGTPTEQKVAKVLKSDPDSVRIGLEDVNQPPRSNAFYEPHQAVDVDSAVPVSKPSVGREVVSDEALVAESLRKSRIGLDGLVDADRKYFTNWKAVTTEEGLQRALQEATSTLKKLKDFPEDLRSIAEDASQFWKENADLANVDKWDDLAKKFVDEMTVPLDPSLPKDALTNSQVTQAGFTSAALIGEELGLRISKQARVINNLDNASTPIDFTDAMERLIELHDKANLFLVPLRRGKRRWAVEGYAQQKGAIKALRDADIKGVKTPSPGSSYDAPARELTTIKVNEADPGRTIRELWDDAKAGDPDALETLKTYVSTIAYADPRTSVSQIDNLSQVLKDQMKKGNVDATAQIRYAFLLSRVRTQVASIASNTLQMVAQPVGAIYSGEKAFGFGQLIGGLSHINDALKIYGDVWKSNKPMIGGTTRLGVDIPDRAARALQIDETYKGLMEQLNKENASFADKLGAHMSYLWQQAANHPVMGLPGRTLMAGDEATQAIMASQYATGRAYKYAAAQKDWGNLDKLIKREFDKVFADGLKLGKITDADVLAAAKRSTFQADIPEDGNFIDQAFLGLKEATDQSAVFKFFFPFPRMMYNALESTGRVGSGVVPMLGQKAMELIPRYKAIMAGEMGDIAKIQLKSQMAMGQLTAMSAVAWAAMGGLTGNNSQTLPKTSFIIPAPGTTTGYIAIDYKRLEPFSGVLATVADLVNGFREDAIGQGEYSRYMSELLFSLGMSTFDKSFMTGLQDMNRILDFKNMNESSATRLAATIAGTFSPSVVRMVGSAMQPYETLQVDKSNLLSSSLAAINQRILGGVGLPVRYDELTGKPIPKVATFSPGKDNYWALVGSSLLNEASFPGAVQPATKGDKVRETMERWDFAPRGEDSYQQYKGVYLSLDDQSKLSKMMYQAGLRDELESFIGSDKYKYINAQYQAYRKQKRDTEGVKASMHAEFRSIYRKTKDRAMEQLINTDESFGKKYYSALQELSTMPN
jgi:hypothetical protein